MHSMHDLSHTIIFCRLQNAIKNFKDEEGYVFTLLLLQTISGPLLGNIFLITLLLLQIISGPLLGTSFAIALLMLQTISGPLLGNIFLIASFPRSILNILTNFLKTLYKS